MIKVMKTAHRQWAIYNPCFSIETPETWEKLKTGQVEYEKTWGRRKEKPLY